MNGVESVTSSSCLPGLWNSIQNIVTAISVWRLQSAGELLLADPRTVPDDKGRIPLQVARSSGHQGLLLQLLDPNTPLAQVKAVCLGRRLLEGHVQRKGSDGVEFSRHQGLLLQSLDPSRSVVQAGHLYGEGNGIP